MTIRFVAAAAAACIVLSADASADMGRITVSAHGVAVSESAQKAIILHNDRREVLILGTEMESTGGKRAPIVRFIPFPSEPRVSLAPPGAFENMGRIANKYGLKYLEVWQSKGPGGGGMKQDGVEVRLSARLGQHDMTVIKVNDVRSFRAWVNGYFKAHRLPVRASYPKEEAIVAQYVKRGIVYFALDAVELGERRFIDPVMYEFESPSLYYPLLTSNSFGGRGEIDLYLFAHTTLCAPGSGMFGETDKAIDDHGRQLGNCLGLPVKASTSAALVPEERDLDAIYPAAGAFFGLGPVFVQAIRYAGPYQFQDDVLVPMPSGGARALGGPRPTMDNPFEHLMPQDRAVCRAKPEPGPCKAAFQKFYFDPATGTCRMFLWGGCTGSVPFETMDECVKTCTLPKN
jgi:hypothetical protein